MKTFNGEGNLFGWRMVIALAASEQSAASKAVRTTRSVSVTGAPFDLVHAVYVRACPSHR